MLIPPEVEPALGEVITGTIPLENGVTSEVYRLETQQNTYLLKCLTGRPPACDPALDSHIRRAMLGKEARVAAPVLQGHGWTLDAYVQGTHPVRGNIPAKACLDLGKTLAALHALPARGYGSPKLGTDGAIHGEEASPNSGLLTRFTNPLPVGLEALSQHPTCRENPALIDVLPPYLTEIRQKMASAPVAICHSDLHERQIILAGDRLAALIDFGEATVADPRWDMASLLYFHGPQALQDTLAGYGGPCNLFRDAHLFSLGVAMHHAARSTIAGKGHRLNTASVHLHDTLLYLAKSGDEGR